MHFRIGNLMRTAVPTNPGGIPSPTAEKLLAKASERYHQEGFVPISELLNSCLLTASSHKDSVEANATLKTDSV